MSERVIRFGAATEDRSKISATWRCWTNFGRDKSVYLTCRELQGRLHLSLHETGCWHVAFDGEHFEQMFEEGSQPESRFAGEWSRPQEIAPGMVLACRIHIPWYSIAPCGSESKRKIVWIPAPAQGMMCEVCVLLSAPGAICTDWPGARAMRTSFVGSFDLQDGSKVWVVARELPLAEPTLPPVKNSHFFKGSNEDSLAAETLRAVVWGHQDDGSVGFFEAPVRVQRN